jgi:hypothetical protein
MELSPRRIWRQGVCEVTICNRKLQYGGRAVSEARWLRELDNENTNFKLRRLDAMLDNVALKDLLKKVRTPAAMREAVVHFQAKHG